MHPSVLALAETLLAEGLIVDAGKTILAFAVDLDKAEHIVRDTVAKLGGQARYVKRNGNEISFDLQGKSVIQLQQFCHRLERKLSTKNKAMHFEVDCAGFRFTVTVT